MLQPDKKVLLYGLGLLACIAAFHVIVFVCWPYAELSEVVAVFNAERFWLQNLNVYSLSKESYLFVKAGYFALFILALVSLYILKFRLSDLWPGTLIRFAGKLKKIWIEIPKAEKVLFAATGTVLIIVRICFIRTVGVHIDESANYLWFLRKGLPGVIFYYPIPNNHVLYSLLCLPLNHIFISPFWVLKLPAFLLSCISTGLFFLALRSVFPFLIAYVATFGISFSYYALYYSVYGRGYILLLICYFLAFVALLKLTESKDKGYWLVFIIATVAGFYTIPVFIYPFIPLFLSGIFIFIRKGNQAGLINFLTIILFAGFASLLLYVPVMLVSGAHQLFGNMYVKQVLTTATFLERLPFYISYTQGALLGQETLGFWAWLIAFLILVVFGVFRKHFSTVWLESGVKPCFFWLVLLSSLIPWFLIAVQKVYPPERVWLFKTLPDFLILAVALQFITVLVFRNSSLSRIIIGGGFILLFGAYEVFKLYRSLPESGCSKGTVSVQDIRKNSQGKISQPFKSRFFLYQNTKAGEVKLQIDEGKRGKGKIYDIIMLDRRDPDSMFFDRKKFPLLFEAKDLQVFVRK